MFFQKYINDNNQFLNLSLRMTEEIIGNIFASYIIALLLLVIYKLSKENLISTYKENA